MTGGAVNQQAKADQEADKIQEQAMKQAEQEKLRFNTKKADLMIENMVAQINEHYDRIIEGLKRAKTAKVQEAKGAMMEMQADPEVGPQGTLPEMPNPDVPFAPDVPEGMPQGMPEGPPQGMPMEGMPQEGMPQGMPQEGMPQEGMPMEGMPQEGMPQEMGAMGDGSEEVIQELSQVVEQAMPILQMSPMGQRIAGQVQAKAEELAQRLQSEGLTPELQQEVQMFIQQLEIQQEIFMTQGGSTDVGSIQAPPSGATDAPMEGMPQGMPPGGVPSAY